MSLIHLATARNYAAGVLCERHAFAMLASMLNIVSILIGVLALLLGLPAFLPFLGWANWFIIPVAVVGAVVGALSSRNGGRNFNLILIVVFGLRLMMGGGII